LIFPSAFVSRIKQQLGEDTRFFFDALADERPISIRLNPAKLRTLSPSHFSAFSSPIPWCSTGHYLDQRPSFTLDPLLHAGCYYVQEAASMFLEEIFNQLKLSEKKLLVLDACAAPGGKSTHLASLISNSSLLVSNEAISSRVSVLKENIIKWGMGNVVITNNDPSAFESLSNDLNGGLFDVIVVDAPCSGEGLFRKDKAAIKEWSEESCNHCVSRQQRILSALLPALKPNGILIYCTCTFNPEENENNINWMIEEYGMESISLTVPENSNIREITSDHATGYYFYPHLTKSEGFFISVLKKKNINVDSADSIFEANRSKKYSNRFEHVNDERLSRMIIPSSNYQIIKSSNLFLFPSEWIRALEFFSEILNIRYAGTTVAEIKNNDVIPQHLLALSVHLNKENFPAIQLTKEEALKYLRKETIVKTAIEKGWMLAEYDYNGGVPLGWVKSVAGRMNNYYPVEWRIRKS